MSLKICFFGGPNKLIWLVTVSTNNFCNFCFTSCITRHSYKINPLTASIMLIFVIFDSAMELMLSLEKLNNEKLASLHLVITVPSSPCFSLLFLLVGG